MISEEVKKRQPSVEEQKSIEYKLQRMDKILQMLPVYEERPGRRFQYIKRKMDEEEDDLVINVDYLHEEGNDDVLVVNLDSDEEDENGKSG